MAIQGIRAKVGMEVYDSWWPWKSGTVCEVLKTRIKVCMSEGIVTYDKGHLQFLRIAG